eukprot:TRINITY_DN13036_c0_g1_i1.p1 TRINITY_DN13036_c0_g1~~TRINITY_DN13036_c0_g1_i1.p1  ORF type:complete len:164 (-),score=37.42 TRINITY_DN13036_c0_g1_i1:362-853(-)
MAADGERQKPALQIALVHLVFNISGIFLFYCIPCMRLPVRLAAGLGNTTADHPWFAVFYLVAMFFVLPITTFGISLLGPYPLYALLAVCASVCFIFSTISFLQTYFYNKLPNILQTWDFLPLPFRSLEPYDQIFSSCCSRQKKGDIENNTQEEKSHKSRENLI